MQLLITTVYLWFLGTWFSYMAVKNQKLHDQFDAAASRTSNSVSSSENIFNGVSIFVDGYTVPSSQVYFEL